MFQHFFTVVFCLIPVICIGQVTFPQLPQPITAFGFEDKDWDIPPSTTARRTSHGPTPKSIPGARVIKTLELKELISTDKSIIVIDVLNAKRSVPGAFAIIGAGDGQFYSAEKSRFSAAMEKLTQGDKNRPVVFLCANSECWLSYNASLYAIEAGYKDVIWYRGGITAWSGASLESKTPEAIRW